MRKVLGSNYFLIVIYLFLTVLTFGKIPYAFFQQDEWAIIGTYLYFDKANLGWFERFFTYEQNTHTIPLSGLTSYFEYKFFGLNFSPYAYFSIVMHLLNVGLVFCLTYLFFRKKLVAFIAALVFLVNSISSQAITWIATTTSTVGATLFTLLSLIFLAKFFLYENKKKFMVLSFIFLFISLLFKEIPIFMFLFIFVFWLVFERKKTSRRGLNFLISIAFVGGLYILPRLFLIFINSSTFSPDGLAYPSLPVYVYRAITFPFKVISQSIIPVDTIITLSDKLVLLGYPDFVHYGFPDPLVSQSIGSDIISYVFSVLIFLTCVWFYKKAIYNNMYSEAKIIIISVAFIALSSLPLIFVPGKAGYFSFFDGRSLYLSSIFKSILLANIVLLAYQLFGKKKITPLLITFFVLFTTLNVLDIRKNIENEIKEGEIRRSMLNKIENSYPTLPPRVIFYTESDSAHYGLSEKIMPFLSGFGQTLLVWYEGHGEDFPACFFKDKYLYAIVEQGYKECEGRGYGYFRKLDSLKDAVRKFNINPQNIISFRYTSNENRLEDISLEIRKKIAL